MHAGSKYSLKEFVLWMRWDSYGILALAVVPTVLYANFHLTWIAVPWVLVALVGTATAFIVGFRNNATYARLWEARQIWGGIVNSSRAWGVMARDLVQPGEGGLDETGANLARSQLIHRHIAWLTALRFQLRQPRAWETMTERRNIEYRAKTYEVAELKGDLGAELRALLPAHEAEEVLAKTNRATQILAEQSAHVARLANARALDGHRYVAIERVIADLYDHQGRCERIKNFPYPRQLATINLYFVRIFTLLLPLGMLHEFQKLSHVWLTIPCVFIVAWVFHTMERVGVSSENPFEGSANDVPMTSMSRAIEIDLREMLGEKDIPPPIGPTNSILM